MDYIIQYFKKTNQPQDQPQDQLPNTNIDVKKIIGLSLIGLTLLGLFDPILRTATVLGIVHHVFIKINDIPTYIIHLSTSK